MAIKINFAAFGSAFVVPTALVDNNIKLATESSLKVLLYVLRHSDKELTVESISDAVLVHPDEVRNAVEFWGERGFLIADNAQPTTPQPTEKPTPQPAPVTLNPEPPVVSKTVVSRLQRPDNHFVSVLLSEDKQLKDLVNDVEFALGKILSPSDKACIVMMRETLGLPCDVINLLVNYCASNGKSNMRAIEKMAVNWSDKGIFTLEDADRMIERMALSNTAWQHVSSLFGIRNIGLPTSYQLNYADTWCNEWKFNDDMLLEAYERCVNTKGEYNIKYINGILKKWYNDKIFNLDDLKIADMSKTKPAKKQTPSERKSTYDIETFESKSLFND